MKFEELTFGSIAIGLSALDAWTMVRVAHVFSTRSWRSKTFLQEDDAELVP
jgi:hypothetical protein